MKTKDILILCILLLAVYGCKNKPSRSTTQTSGTEDTITPDTSCTTLPDSLFFMLQDKPLPRHVDLNQDISRLSYNSLRLLRSYVYATHGHWFMEEN